MKNRYFGRFVPKKSWFDFNGDGDVDYQDFIAAAQNTLNCLTPSKNILDLNGDGVIDIHDALDAARITGAAIVGAGVTLGTGAVVGSVLVTGKATAIATVITSAIGAAAGSGVGMVLGSTMTGAVSAVQLANGVWIVGVKTIVATSPAFVTSISSAGVVVANSAQGVVNTISGFPVVQAMAINSLANSDKIIMIAGVPIAREIALAVGLVCLVIVGGYAYYVMTKNHIGSEEVQSSVDGTPIIT